MCKTEEAVMGTKSVCVVVMGDIGRSPRMQYHALSLASRGYDVDFVGYKGSEPIKELKDNPHVEFKHIPPCPDIQKYVPRLAAYIWKTLWQSITLFFTLLLKCRPHYVLVQTPPAIPTLGVCWLYALLVRAKFIIDWHNYAFTILALVLGHGNILVEISKAFEGFFGRKSHANLCVTRAMKMDLRSRYSIDAIILYDKPPDHFKPVSVKAAHELFLKLSKDFDVFKSVGEGYTVFTEVKEDGSVVLKENRPGLLVSSTSWTEDEDFSVLLSALESYEEASKEGVQSLPHLICVITGKGPMKKYYSDLIAKKSWKYVDIVTPWLEPDDYPKLLASADLGVCLHISSSGLDLPMKVADMFGCGLPVCAHNFACLGELVRHEENGFVFNTSEELSTQIQSWFKDFPQNESQKALIKKFKTELEIYQCLRWDENWALYAYNLFV